jgi:hypothetical protein
MIPPGGWCPMGGDLIAFQHVKDLGETLVDLEA